MEESARDYTFTVPSQEANIRLDVYLQTKVPDLSRTRIQDIIDGYLVEVNGKVMKPSYRTMIGDQITMTVPPPAPVNLEPEAYPLKIVYEDSHIMVINKDPGVSVHPTAGNYKHTLINYILAWSKDLSGIAGELRPGIVHRLDKETTGLMVIAKNDAAHLSLSEQFKSRTVEKIYYAIVKGRVLTDEGYIRKSIMRDPVNRKRMTALDSVTGGKPALTHYLVVERFEHATFLRIRLHTGRTHQIRVHFSSIGHPLFGDSIYLNRKRDLDHYGLALVSKEIRFRHPVDGREMYFQIDLPDHMKVLLERLRREDREERGYEREY